MPQYIHCGSRGPSSGGRGDRALQSAQGLFCVGPLRQSARRRRRSRVGQPGEGLLVRCLSTRCLRRGPWPRAQRRGALSDLGDRAVLCARDEHHVGCDATHGADQPAGDRPAHRPFGSPGAAPFARARQGSLRPSRDRGLPRPGRCPADGGPSPSRRGARLPWSRCGAHGRGPEGRLRRRRRLALWGRRCGGAPRALSARGAGPLSLPQPASPSRGLCGDKAAHRGDIDVSRLRATWFVEVAERIGLRAFMDAAGIVCSQRLGDLVCHLAKVTEARAVAHIGGSF